MKKIDVFHKDKKPALKTLEKAKPVLGKYKESYKISYYLITDPRNADLIKEYRLPETHFPFAVVIDGKYSAKIDAEKIDFVHFPHFMHGIGRHEGNWSLEHLERVLTDNSLLLDENILPELDHEEDEEEPCEE